MNLLNYLKGYRIVLGLSQLDMAKKLDISRQAYSEKERGNVSFKDNEKMEILEMYKQVNPNISLYDIFFANKVTNGFENKGE